jgi:N-acetylmuramoyl-L-alanine amidase
VEVGYLSNKAEEKLLRSEAYRRKICQAILKAIDGYFAVQRNAEPS